MIKVRIEGFSFRNVDSEGRFEVVTSGDVVNVVDTSGSHSHFGEIGGPSSSIGIFGLILGVVRGIDSIRNNSISFVPFLIIVLFEVVVGRVDGEVIGYHGGEF